MIKLTIKTERIFKSAADFKRYIEWHATQPLLLNIDFKELIEKGKTEDRTHIKGEIVKTTYLLENGK